QEGRGGRIDDVVARLAGAQLGVERLVGIVHRIVDLDAGRLGEIVDRVLGDVVGPVVDVDLTLGRGRAGCKQRGESCGDGQAGTVELHLDRAHVLGVRVRNRSSPAEHSSGSYGGRAAL